MNMVSALRSALTEEMERDERVMVLGEDVGKKGGVFLVTDGLYNRFGEARVIDTPLAESSIAGVALGLALAGKRPVAEMQFTDFAHMAFNQVTNEIAKFYRSDGDWSVPMVVRAPMGGHAHGALYHSQSIEARFATPGLKIVIPSSPYEAKGLLLAAIRDPDPVLFFEHKRLYRMFKGRCRRRCLIPSSCSTRVGDLKLSVFCYDLSPLRAQRQIGAMPSTWRSSACAPSTRSTGDHRSARKTGNCLDLSGTTSACRRVGDAHDRRWGMAVARDAPVKRLSLRLPSCHALAWRTCSRPTRRRSRPRFETWRVLMWARRLCSDAQQSRSGGPSPSGSSSPATRWSVEPMLGVTRQSVQGRTRDRHPSEILAKKARPSGQRRIAVVGLEAMARLPAQRTAPATQPR
jgi:hypothetical protein